MGLQRASSTSETIGHNIPNIENLAGHNDRKRNKTIGCLSRRNINASAIRNTLYIPTSSFVHRVNLIDTCLHNRPNTITHPHFRSVLNCQVDENQQCRFRDITYTSSKKRDSANLNWGRFRYTWRFDNIFPVRYRGRDRKLGDVISMPIMKGAAEQN